MRCWFTNCFVSLIKTLEVFKNLNRWYCPSAKFTPVQSVFNGHKLNILGKNENFVKLSSHFVHPCPFNDEWHPRRKSYVAKLTRWLKITAIFCEGMNAFTTTTWAQNSLRTNVVTAPPGNKRQANSWRFKTNSSICLCFWTPQLNS